jgi:hypothetical protein
MSQHYCEYDAQTNGRFDIEPCGAPATAKAREVVMRRPPGVYGRVRGPDGRLNEFAREGEGEL